MRHAVSRREWLRGWGTWLRDLAGEVAPGEDTRPNPGDDPTQVRVAPVPMPREKSLGELWPVRP